MSKKLTVSLIIPCYNEDKVIKRCLKHVAAQTVSPMEVILVDNNCTDSTVRIARQFPFVTVVREKEQGLIPARNRGFEFAKGDILARIDADTRLSPGWVRTVRDNLSGSDLQGVTGPAKAILDVHLPFIKSEFWSKIYFLYMRQILGFDVLWGPNMAIRRNAYRKIKIKLETNGTAVHEDQDISILMHAKGLKIKYLPQLKITVDGSRSADIRKILEYDIRRRRTIERHIQSGNLPPKKYNAKNSLVLAVMLPLGAWALLQGLLYSIENRLGLRNP